LSADTKAVGSSWDLGNGNCLSVDDLGIRFVVDDVCYELLPKSGGKPLSRHQRALKEIGVSWGLIKVR
jgi:hypothetical protein